MVIDHIENDFDASLMQGFHHPLEFSHCSARAFVGHIVWVGGEVGNGVVAPVVAQSSVDQISGLHEVMHRHQLDSGDTELLQIVDRRRMHETGVGALQFRRDVRMECGEAFNVQFVDDGFVPRALQLTVTGPVEEGLLDDALGHEGRAIRIVAHVGARAELVRK